jgi:hypothetical protein
VRARDERVQVVDGHGLGLGGRDDGHDLLGEHVERVARHDGRLDPALAHEAGDHGALEQVGAELREDPALGGVADVVAGAADALQARATDFGDSTCSTRSTAPMSMPSSSDEVATGRELPT